MPAIEYSDTMRLLFVAAFLGAVVHALLSHRFLLKARALEKAGRSESISYALYTLAGHPTSVFTLWLLPTFLVLTAYFGPKHIEEVFTKADLKEPFANFTFIFLALSPALHEAFTSLTTSISRRLGGSLKAWWGSGIFLAVVLSGVLSEVGMMIVLCYTFAKTLAPLKPSPRFYYVTLAILLSTMSLGNLVIPFNITASMDQSTGWGWSHWTILQLLSWRVLLTIAILIAAAFRILKSDFAALEERWNSSNTSNPSKISTTAVGYVLLILLAGYFEEISFFLVSIVAFVCVVEHSTKDLLQTDRLRLPLLIALFSYSLELHAFFLSHSIKALYLNANPAQYTSLSTALAALNEHLPGIAFVHTYEPLTITAQAMGILAIAVGSGVTIFANSANVEAHVILHAYFPDKVISGVRLCLYTIPIAIISILILNATFLLA